MTPTRTLAHRPAAPLPRGTSDPEPLSPGKMSQGATLFSHGVVGISDAEADRWRDRDGRCPLRLDRPGPGVWDRLPVPGADPPPWGEEAAAATCSVTSLIGDLSLSDPPAPPAPSAPPSKRPCRPLSFSDETSGCRVAWRPLGSRVWTPVEKRRCLSGGSVQRRGGGGGAMRRSSSFSLPSGAGPLSSARDRPGRPLGQGPPGGRRAELQRSLSCSHEPLSAPEWPPSPGGTPASTPEAARRSAGLARSRSQPCVHHDRKAGIKRRRPAGTWGPRPSLDLAKMTQNCQTFNSLCCLRSPGDDRRPQTRAPPGPGATPPWAAPPPASQRARAQTPAGTPPADPRGRGGGERAASRDGPADEEPVRRAVAGRRGGAGGRPGATWSEGRPGGDAVFPLDDCEPHVGPGHLSAQYSARHISLGVGSRGRSYTYSRPSRGLRSRARRGAERVQAPQGEPSRTGTQPLPLSTE
ncbi:protein FAM53B isoform X2 [Ornithorhynchus anatinus]|uniref:protein FAM53B isoform X2 n=1 Tax=Ornithorhynchus anatinus TaxID=9258 RepID=UPI0010A8D59E|nr:protein FAM53B isoform X2 [Ornithorhynchus anatinus]